MEQIRFLVYTSMLQRFDVRIRHRAFIYLSIFFVDSL